MDKFIRVAIKFDNPIVLFVWLVLMYALGYFVTGMTEKQALFSGGIVFTVCLGMLKYMPWAIQDIKDA